MHYTGQVYRHPMEARTPLLEVTIGCSHNKCSFCTMYRETPFRTSKIEHVEEDLQELKSTYGALSRIYLVNADPFVLSTNKLVKIAELILQYFPMMETITCYTSIKNIKNKSVDDLKLLKSLKYNDLHIGLESGYDPALKIMNKGYTRDEAIIELQKLKKAGMRWDALLMLGVAGKGKSEINTEATASLLNDFPPYMISIMPTSVTPGSDLEKICDNGDYLEQTELEMLEEEKMLLQALTFEDAFFFGSHNFNLVPISGSLKDKKDLIASIDDAIDELSPKVLQSIKPRGPI